MMHRLDLQSGLVAAAWRENTIGTLFEMAKRAPGQPLLLDFGSRTVLLLQDAEHARDVLRTNADNFRKNFGGFQGLFGDSRLTADGPRWEFLHSLSQPYLNAASPATVASFTAAAFNGAADQMLANDKADRPVLVDGFVNRAAARIACDLVFGFHGLDVDAVLDDFRSVLRFGADRNWNFDGSSTSTAEQKGQYAQARRRLTEVVEALVHEAAGAENGSELVRDIVMGEPLGVDVTAELCSLLFAAFDTTSSAVTWAMYLLAASPDLQRFLRDRIRASGSEARSHPAAYSEIPELVAFQNEVLRIFPPIPVLGRMSAAAGTVGDIPVDGGQVVLLSIIGLHQDRRYFQDPTQLRLSRYTDGQLDRSLRGHFLPFADGRRACGGGRMANTELTTALGTLIDRLEVNIADQDPILFEWTVSLRRLGGQKLLVRSAG